MGTAKSNTIDGRAAYKTAGGSKVQPVYKRGKKGEYLRDDAGNPIIVKWRMIRYGWTIVNSKKVKTRPVSVLLDKDPKTMLPAEYRAVERELSALLLHATTAVDLIRGATDRLRDSLESGGEDLEAQFGQASRKVTRLLEQRELKDAASKAAVAEFLEVAQSCAKWSIDKSKDVAKEADSEAAGLANTESLLAATMRYTSLGAASVQYLLDTEGVKAGDTTRRIYGSYLRNHILVPTADSRQAIGEHLISNVTKDVLRSFERSMYKEREGFKLANSLFDAEGIVNFQEYLAVGSALNTRGCRQRRLRPETVEKIIAFIASVIEWAMQDPKRWSLHSYPINLAAKYKMVESSSPKRKTFAPRSSEFFDLIEAAEELKLGYMIPLLALTRCTFRPSESRAIRWIDLGMATVDGKSWTTATLHGSIRDVPGKGEYWAPSGKTLTSLDEPVVIPDSMLDLLKKNRVEGCEFVVPPSPIIEGKKNSDRKSKPFLTKDAYADAWKLIKEKAGLPASTHMYTLKHGLITELLLEGWEPKTITLMTRHTTEQMVMRFYNAINSSNLAAAIDNISHASQDRRSLQLSKSLDEDL